MYIKGESMDFKNTETIKNLTRAFASECQDGAKYQYMADEAEQSKMSEVSTILKGLATNEMAHAKIFYDYIAECCETTKNLVVDIKASYPMEKEPLEKMLSVKAENEQFQAETVYPAFAKTAKKEGYEDIANKLMVIADIEQNHNKTLKTLYDKIKNNSLYQENQKTLWACNNCGYQESSKKAWKKCPLCAKNQGFVKLNIK